MLAVTALAALLRLPGIDARGQFDADQGHDMRVLAAFTRDGVVPLLGPKTSVGEFHHGAFYYFLLAPAAALSNGDPVGVTAFIALLRIAAVALTWWLARAIAGPSAGPLAGALAGLLLAVSPAAIEESTFIWNPNPIGFFAVLALAAAWSGRASEAADSRRRWWWALALGAAGAVTQLHVLGVVFLVAILALAVIALRRDRSVAVGIVGGLGLVGVLFLPLIVHELQTGFAETRLVVDYVRGGDQLIGGNPVFAIAFTLMRVVGWPLVGLVTDALAVTAILLVVLIALFVLDVVGGDAAKDQRWLVGILAWSTLALAFAAPSLQRVVPGLPNDHYHAFLDPIVAILFAVPAAGLLTAVLTAWRTSRRAMPLVATVALATAIAVLVLIPVARMPPQLDPNGGWPHMRDAGKRIVADVGAGPIQLVGLPGFKLSDAVGYPIEYAGGQVAAEPSTIPTLVVACDRLFEDAGGYTCGGPAEDALARQLVDLDYHPHRYALVDRFDASPRTSISVYAFRIAP